MKLKIFLISFLIGLSNLSLSAQRDLSSASYQGEITELIVTDSKSRAVQLRKQIEVAEAKAFNLFNELNDDDEFDIYCKNVARLGTTIKLRQCEPVFLSEAKVEEGKFYLNAIRDSYSGHTLAVAQTLAIKNPILKEKMETLARENPGFNQTLTEHLELKNELREIMNAHYNRD